MDPDRLIRLTAAGWAFILTWLLQLWILGFDFSELASKLSQMESFSNALLGFLIAVTAGPVLGFILSTFSYGILRVIRGGEPEFDLPSQEGFPPYATALRQLLPDTQIQEVLSAIEEDTISNPPKSKRKKKENIDQLIRYFNLLFHTRAPSTLIQYCTRRWTIYWMVANSICALTIGIIFGVFTAGDFWNRHCVSIFNERYLVSLFMLLFVVMGLLRINRIPKEIYSIAWLWLLTEANKQSATSMVVSPDPQPPS